jgi:uncharacterized protein
VDLRDSDTVVGTITTIGTGEVTGSPDRMRVRISVQGRDRALARAVDQCAALGDRLVAVARDLTSPDQIASNGFQVWTEREDDGSTRPVAEHTYVVDCPTFAAASDLVTVLTHDLGAAVSVQGISPRIGDETPLRRLARERAFEHARAKAEELAGYARGGVGAVVRISEAGAGSPVQPLAAETHGQFQPGSTTVTATLTVTWRLT